MTKYVANLVLKNDHIYKIREKYPYARTATYTHTHT